MLPHPNPIDLPAAQDGVSGLTLIGVVLLLLVPIGLDLGMTLDLKEYHEESQTADNKRKQDLDAHRRQLAKAVDERIGAIRGDMLDMQKENENLRRELQTIRGWQALHQGKVHGDLDDAIKAAAKAGEGAIDKAALDAALAKQKADGEKTLKPLREALEQLGGTADKIKALEAAVSKVQAGSADAAAMRKLNSTVSSLSRSLASVTSALNTQKTQIADQQKRIGNLRTELVNKHKSDLDAQSKKIAAQATTIANHSDKIDKQGKSLTTQASKLTSQASKISSQGSQLRIQAGKVDSQKRTIDAQAKTISNQARTITDQAKTVSDMSKALAAQSTLLDALKKKIAEIEKKLKEEKY